MNNLHVFLCFTCRHKAHWMHLDRLSPIHAQIITFVKKRKRCSICISCCYLLHMLWKPGTYPDWDAAKRESKFAVDPQSICALMPSQNKIRPFCLFGALQGIRNSLRLRGEKATNGENLLKKILWKRRAEATDELQRKINKIIQSGGEEDTEVWKRVHWHICWKSARAGGVA